LKIGVVQLSSSPDREKNLARCAAFFRRGSREHVDLLVFPENVLCRGKGEGYRGSASRIPGEVSSRLALLSREYSMAAVWGGIVEETDDGLYNTSLFFSRSGDLIATYRKMHLFALYDGERVCFREQDVFLHGADVVVVPHESLTFGMSICYDVRFPELYRSLVGQGANAMLVPSDFTRPTGRAHWLPLLRARAIENLCYVIAANQCGVNRETDAQSHGNSCIIDPWGEVVAALDGEEEGMCVAEVSLGAVESSRRRIRALDHIRL